MFGTGPNRDLAGLRDQKSIEDPGNSILKRSQVVYARSSVDGLHRLQGPFQVPCRWLEQRRRVASRRPSAGNRGRGRRPDIIAVCPARPSRAKRWGSAALTRSPTSGFLRRVRSKRPQLGGGLAQRVGPQRSHLGHKARARLRTSRNHTVVHGTAAAQSPRVTKGKPALAIAYRQRASLNANRVGLPGLHPISAPTYTYTSSPPPPRFASPSPTHARPIPEAGASSSHHL